MDERREKEPAAGEPREPNVARPSDPNADAPEPSRTSWGFAIGCLGVLLLIGIMIAVTQMGY